jgi:TRAP-type C4-dicarboxylate transport system permease small subunit
MRTLVDWYFRLLKLLVVACMAVMVVMVFGNVVLRYAFNSGISVSEELSRWCFVWMVFLGALIALREHAHLGLDSVVKRLPPKGQRICLVVGHLLMLFVCWLITKGSWAQAVINLDVTAPASGLSMAWFYAAGVVFGVSASAILLVELIQALRGRLNGTGHSDATEPMIPATDGRIQP